MQAISKFLSKYNLSTHTLAIIAIVLTIAYEGYAPFHALVQSAYAGMPGWLQVLIGTGGFLFALYKSGALKAKVSAASSTAQLGVLVLCSLLVFSSLPIVGCTPQQKISVAQAIVNDTPAVIAAVDVISAGVQTFEPVTAIILNPFTEAFNAIAPQFQQAAQAYLANPNQTTLQVLADFVNQLQQNANAGLLAAAKITNPASQLIAEQDMKALAAIINSVLSLVQSLSNKAMLERMAQPIQLADGTVRHITLAQVRPYLDAAQLQALSDRTTQEIGIRRVSTGEWFAAEARLGF